MDDILQKVVKVIVNPIIQVMFALALILFVYGIFNFVRGADNPEVRKQGQQHMLYGLIGLTIMVSVFTIMHLVLNTLGVNGGDVPKILPNR